MTKNVAWVKEWRKKAEDPNTPLSYLNQKCCFYREVLADNLELKYIPYSTNNTLAGELQVVDVNGYGLYGSAYIKKDTSDEWVLEFINNLIERYGYAIELPEAEEDTNR